MVVSIEIKSIVNRIEIGIATRFKIERTMINSNENHINTVLKWYQSFNTLLKYK